ncbi:hypothetical protein FRC00_008316 [Tulasnella sp. 408]|nr:hypothetical protein FRC00_008316 [Tulasnella sp. 408]
MAPTQSSEQSTVVFLRYREHVAHNRIILSAQLPQYPAQGVVEIHPDSWPAVSNDVEVFEVEEADAIDQLMYTGCPISSSGSQLASGCHEGPAGWQPGSRTLQRIRELGETYQIDPNIYSALRSGPLPPNNADSCDTVFPTRSIQTDRKYAPESADKVLDYEAEGATEIVPEPRRLAKRLSVRFLETELRDKEVDETKKDKRAELKVKMPPKPTRRSSLLTQPDTAVDSKNLRAPGSS